MLLSRFVLLAVVFLLAGCQDITVRESPELEGDDPGECEDGADNDADGLFDCLDDDCAGAPVCGCDDSDGDGICDDEDACPGEDDGLDGDGDGVADGCDPCPGDDSDDSDGDGVCDSEDACPGEDDGLDGDGDGVADGCDPCPGDDPDDSDGDGVCDSEDACPGENDGLDGDGDGVADGCDPCPGDDPDDSDGDGVCDGEDACPGEDDGLDGDGDGVADGCDPCPGDDPDDSDGDGICDSADACPGSPDGVDGDGDGVADGCDVCAGGDDTVDTDGDGTPDFCESTGGPGQILVSDGITGMVYALDTAGNVQGSWPAGVGQLRGVTHDRRNGDGFWVLDNAAPTLLRKLNWSGALVTTVTSTYAAGVDVRGIDYWLDPTGADRLAYVARNPNSIDVSYHVLVANGQAQLESSFYNGGFQAGYWGLSDLLDGVAITAFERRATRGSNGIEEFVSANQSGPAVTVPGGVTLRGISAVDASTSYVVDNAGQQILLVDHNTGAVLGSFLAPGPDPLGLSYAP